MHVLIHDGRLTEVPLPRTEREPYEDRVTGVLDRTDHPGDGVTDDA
ncbi:hypothetical protein ACFYXS_38625 [Streptomyces sp. NPDC002574]